MPIEVSDRLSNINDQIANAVKIIGRSRDRLKVFMAVYSGKKRIKTVTEISKVTELPRIRVLQEGRKLKYLLISKKVDGETAYQKDDFCTLHRDKIVSLVRNPRGLKKLPTKVSPKTEPKIITVSYPRNQVRVKQLTIDDIDSFSKVAGAKSGKFEPLPENVMKRGIKSILGEEGEFNDWGGETDDLFSTRIVYKGSRHAVAIGLKGRATKGVLTPKKMGRNGDQIQRLFRAPADVFLIQYHGQIAEFVVEQMQKLAIAKSYAEGRPIYFGIIDANDTSRLIQAYSEHFSLESGFTDSK